MKTLIIAIAYLEPSWTQTRDCLLKCDNKVVIVDREGTGSMAGAYNHAFKKHAKGYEYVWFVSNVVFEEGTVEKLEFHMEQFKDLAGIHPTMATSDHHHMRPTSMKFQKSEVIQQSSMMIVPFIEFTAPLVRVDVFSKIMLDENMPYVGHDLDWGYRVREAGHKVGVHHGTSIEHTYIRHSLNHQITIDRLSKRNESKDETHQALIRKYGDGWEDKLKYFNGL